MNIRAGVRFVSIIGVFVGVTAIVGPSAGHATRRDVTSSAYDGGSYHPQIVSAASPSSLSRSQLTQTALAEAAAMGDAQPTSVVSVPTTRERANLLASGELAGRDSPAFLIVVQGSFRVPDVLAPAGSSGSAQGDVLTLVVDASTGEITDVGVQDDLPDVSALGIVSQEVGPPAATARTKTGLLTGGIYVGGGPAGAMHLQPVAGTAIVLAASGTQVAHERVANGKFFSFRLAPGRYRLTVAHNDCAATQAAVRAGRTTHADIAVGCTIP